MIWRIPGISLNLHYPKEDDGELYTACPIIKGSRGIEPLNPLPQRRIRLTLPAYLCLKTALRRSEIREYYKMGGWFDEQAEKVNNAIYNNEIAGLPQLSSEEFSNFARQASAYRVRLIDLFEEGISSIPIE